MLTSFLSLYPCKYFMQLAKNMTNCYGSVLDGSPFNGRLTSLKCLAQFLGRHLVPFSQIKSDVNLHPVLSALYPSPDLLVFRGIASQYQFSRLFSAILGFKMKLQVRSQKNTTCQLTVILITANLFIARFYIKWNGFQKVPQNRPFHESLVTPFHSNIGTC